MGRFLLPLIVSGLTIIAVNSALAKGSRVPHLSTSQSPPVSRAGVPALSLSPNDFLSGCGRGRYRDPATRRCRGPADIGN
jgi:hypothetical protein